MKGVEGFFSEGGRGRGKERRGGRERRKEGKRSPEKKKMKMKKTLWTQHRSMPHPPTEVTTAPQMVGKH